MKNCCSKFLSLITLFLGLGFVGSLGPGLASAAQDEFPTCRWGRSWSPAGSFRMGDNLGDA